MVTICPPLNTRAANLRCWASLKWTKNRFSFNVGVAYLSELFFFIVFCVCLTVEISSQENSIKEKSKSCLVDFFSAVDSLKHRGVFSVLFRSVPMGC